MTPIIKIPYPFVETLPKFVEDLEAIFDHVLGQRFEIRRTHVERLSQWEWICASPFYECVVQYSAKEQSIHILASHPLFPERFDVGDDGWVALLRRCSEREEASRRGYRRMVLFVGMYIGIFALGMAALGIAQWLSS